MEYARLESLLARFPTIAVLVVGDFFLDKYLHIERTLAEDSLETGLEAHQVVAVNCSPGAAGTVAANLSALGVRVQALGVIGEDGEGYELRRALHGIAVDTSYLIEDPARFTPTYTKPIMHEPDGAVHELSRLDIKNRTPLPPETETLLISHLRAAVPHVHGIVITDQVPESNCGIISDRVRAELCTLAHAHPSRIFAADSREHIGAFRDMILKPNAREAVRALHPEGDPSDHSLIQACGTALAAQARRPVFVTLGAAGILLCDENGCESFPALPVNGPLDTVGAGDSVMAGLAAALCAGASEAEAAFIGNLVASITIQQIGATGAASREDVLTRGHTLAPTIAS